MAILQALLLALARRAGQLLNTVFGWATSLLFGKVAEERQLYLSAMTLGAVLWLVTLVGILLPEVGTFLLAFIPLPDWVEENWIRLIMLGLAVALPPVIGAIGAFAIGDRDRPKTGQEWTRAVLRGYPYTLGLAITLVLMTLFAPFLMLPRLIKRWETQHIPVIVEAADYNAVLEEVEQTMQSAGWPVQRTPAPWMLRLPTRILTGLAGSVVDSYVAENLTTLKSDGLEATLHPADLVLAGEKEKVVHLRALIAEQMAFSRANMCWTEEAVALEDMVAGLWRELRQGAAPDTIQQRIKALEKQRNQLKISYEEWEVLERQQLLVERALLEAVTRQKPLQEPHEKKLEERAGVSRGAELGGVSPGSGADSGAGSLEVGGDSGVPRSSLAAGLAGLAAGYVLGRFQEGSATDRASDAQEPSPR